MGAPLILIGSSAGKLLPKAGEWMDTVKYVFGVLLLAVAIWLLERIVPATVTMVLWALLLVLSAAYMGALEPLKQGASGWTKLWKGLGVVFLIYGAMLFIGAAAGGSDPLQPLRGIALGSGNKAPAHLAFKTIKSTDDLQREVTAASDAGKAVMLDFYADWCISCKEFEKYTFSDSSVQQTLANAVLLQADVTLNDDADKALLKQFSLLGPPSILFFGTSGEECRNYRIVGFMEVEEFQPHAAKALSC
jgi:thiol:disulfide interchange protein DsbD